MSCRVLIPTAGTGSRLHGMTQYINKSLVSIANRPTICHIIEQFEEDAEFVIALGYKGDLVRDFLDLAYPNRIFMFAEVTPYEGDGSGLGLSILSCKQYLQQPFVFISCDTLVKEVIPDLSENWMGYADLNSLEQYRTLEIKSNQVQSICEKGIGKIGTHKPYIGLAGVKDYKEFWNAMVDGSKEAILVGESFGLRNMVNLGIAAHKFTWFDTGNVDALAKTRDAYREPDEPNILEKANEAIWFVDKQVVKFSDDKKFIANRVQRAQSINEFIPAITAARSNMYRYSKVDGLVMSEIVSLPLFSKLLDYSKSFWQSQALNAADKQAFQSVCMKFYKNKTLERIALFFKNFDKSDGSEKINDMPMPPIKQILDTVDWDWLSDGLPGRFHGDFHFENILYSTASQKFTFLDWRQEFGGSLTTGDVYYDLAKLLHGLIVCHELIAQNQYSVEWTDNEIRYDLHRKHILVQCEQLYSRWLTANGYDCKKVWVLTSLVYLNIAALHHYPYSLMLFALGKEMLYNNL